MAKVEKPKAVERGKDKAPSNNELKQFTSLRAEVEAKLEASEAKFSAAEMGVGQEATLGAKFLRLFEDVKRRAEAKEAYNAYDPYNKVYLTGGIKSQDQFQKYQFDLIGTHSELEELEAQFDIELESGRTGNEIDDVLAA